MKKYNPNPSYSPIWGVFDTIKSGLWCLHRTEIISAKDYVRIVREVETKIKQYEKEQEEVK